LAKPYVKVAFPSLKYPAGRISMLTARSSPAVGLPSSQTK
jgi:hypothetical protein